MAFWVLGERMRVFPYGPLVQAHVNPKYPLVVGDGCEVIFEARIEVVPVGEFCVTPKALEGFAGNSSSATLVSRHFRILAFSTNVPFLKLH